jgi:hypothetical protein
MNKAQATNIKVQVDAMMKCKDTKAFLEAMCHFRKPVYVGNSEAALIAEGQRQVYLTLLTISEHEPEELVKLYEEKGV